MANRTIGALWVRKSKGGMTYMSGTLNDLSGDIQIAVFKNSRKEKENQPDYQIILSEKKQERSPIADDPFLTPATKHETPSFEESGYATKQEIESAGDIPVVEDDPKGEDDIDVNKIPF